MTTQDLARLVAEMRRAQREWFDPRTRTQPGLERSKRLERSVDKAVGEILEAQEQLFGF